MLNIYIRTESTPCLLRNGSGQIQITNHDVSPVYLNSETVVACLQDSKNDPALAKPRRTSYINILSSSTNKSETTEDTTTTSTGLPTSQTNKRPTVGPNGSGLLTMVLGLAPLTHMNVEAQLLRVPRTRPRDVDRES